MCVCAYFKVFKVYKESKRLKCRISRRSCSSMMLKRFNGIETEAVKRYRQVVDGRQIRLARLPKKESTELAFLSLRTCLTMMKSTSLSHDWVYYREGACQCVCDEEEKKEEEEEQEEKAACSEKTVVTPSPSACQGLVTCKQRDTPFHKGRPSSINNVEGS